MEKVVIHKKNENLWLVDLDQPLPGFRNFISCWIYQSGDFTFLVDPGPASTIPVVLNALESLSIQNIDFILLTHIHIDHAGGSGLLLDIFPEVQVICHTKGIDHMVEPSKLWQGTLHVLGETARAYGPIAPVPKQNISFKNTIHLNHAKIEILETPGHAVHHLNFLINGCLFVGEAAGVHLALKNDFYLRIATPPRFIYEVYKNSLFKISTLDCDTLCFGHYGLNNHPTTVFNSAQQQLELWVDVIREFADRNKTEETEEIFNLLLQRDIQLSGFKQLDTDIQQREKYFALNSIKGMLDYFKT
jgi:glyoxylase-like metal-dependent hydrolase (beta-lactamase superfamily II)